MDDDLRDLLDPGEDPRVAAALRRIQADLLVAPDEITAARHRRQRRQLGQHLATRPLRRTAVAVLLAVVGTGAIVSSMLPAPVVPGAPAGEELDVVDERPTPSPDRRVTFTEPPGPAVTELPSFGDRLPAPGPVPAAPEPDAPDPAERGPVHDRTTPVGPPPVGPPTTRPDAHVRPTDPAPQSQTPARRPRPATPGPAGPSDPPGAPDASGAPDRDPAAGTSTATGGAGDASPSPERPSTDTPRADNAQDGEEPTPGADGRR